MLIYRPAAAVGHTVGSGCKRCFKLLSYIHTYIGILSLEEVMVSMSLEEVMASMPLQSVWFMVYQSGRYLVV